MGPKVWKTLENALSLSVFSFFWMACTNQIESEPEVVTPAVQQMKQDSIFVYHVAPDRTETLAQITYYFYDIVGNMTCQLDSFMGAPYHTKAKVEKKYDSNGNVIEMEEATYISSQAYWYGGFWWIYEYDADNKLKQFALYEHFSDTTNYPPFKKGLYSWLDEMHAECLVYNYEYGAKEPWHLVEKVEYSYNAYGDVEKSVSYDYWCEDSLWKLWYTHDYTYDQYGNVVFHIEHKRGELQLLESNKYEYDTAGNILVRWYSSSKSEKVPENPETKYVYFY